MKQDLIIILDLGSEKNCELAREIRDYGVYSEIYPYDTTAEELKKISNLKGIILNGGKNNIVDGKEIDIDNKIYSMDIPMAACRFNKALCENLTALPKFLFDKCKCEKNWNMQNFIDDQIALIRKKVGNKKVLLALSGGVDSSVVAALMLKAVGKNTICVHVNHGLLRKGESEQVVNIFSKQLGAELVYVDAAERFLNKLEGIAEPEEKRKIIGNEFIRIFEEEARKLDGIEFLAQGTIYPDIVESGTKTSKAVKAHHNVGGLPEDLKFELIEPLKYLFKDEVRSCGKALGLPDNLIYRQPFPGPGLGVRCLGVICRERLEAVRESDAILHEEFEKANLAGKVWQYFTCIPDFKSVGMRDNARTYEWPCIIRAVNTVDAMTATIEHIDWEVLDRIAERIMNEVKGVNRVCYDLSKKPNATIEWE